VERINSLEVILDAIKAFIEALLDLHRNARIGILALKDAHYFKN